MYLLKCRGSTPISNIELSKPANLLNVGSTEHDAPTHLSGRALWLARATWLTLILLNLLLFSVTITATYDDTIQQGLTIDSAGLAQLGMSVGDYAAFLARSRGGIPCERRRGLSGT